MPEALVNDALVELTPDLFDSIVGTWIVIASNEGGRFTGILKAAEEDRLVITAGEHVAERILLFRDISSVRSQPMVQINTGTHDLTTRWTQVRELLVQLVEEIDDVQDVDGALDQTTDLVLRAAFGGDGGIE